MQIVLSPAFVILFCVTTQTLAIRCYICGPGAQQPFKNAKTAAAGGFNSYDSPNLHGHGNNNNSETPASSSATGATNVNTINSIFIPSCQDFETKTNFLQEFMMECPTLYSGCITEIEGNRTTRTCEILDINDCKIANNITYCYCSSDLCNGEKVSILTRRAWKSNDPMENSDDEDFVESSGMDENGYRKRKNRINSVIGIGENNAGTTVKIHHALLLHSLICVGFYACIIYIPKNILKHRIEV